MKYTGFSHRITYLPVPPPEPPKKHFHFEIPPGTALKQIGDWPHTEHSGYFEWVEESEVQPSETLPARNTEISGGR